MVRALRSTLQSDSLCHGTHPAVLLAAAQNPDPKATNYFAEYITKAYQALTDEASRLNYEKYGHPDGPQVGVEGQGRRA